MTRAEYQTEIQQLIEGIPSPSSDSGDLARSDMGKLIPEHRIKNNFKIRVELVTMLEDELVRIPDYEDSTNFEGLLTVLREEVKTKQNWNHELYYLGQDELDRLVTLTSDANFRLLSESETKERLDILAKSNAKFDYMAAGKLLGVSNASGVDPCIKRASWPEGNWLFKSSDQLLYREDRGHGGSEIPLSKEDREAVDWMVDSSTSR